MLKNEHLLILAKVGVDTAENEPDVEIWSDGLLVLLIVNPETMSRTHGSSPCVRVAA